MPRPSLPTLGVLLVATAALAGGSATAAGATRAAKPPVTVTRVRLQLEDTTRPTPANGTYPGAASRTLPTVVSYAAKGGKPIGTKLPLVVFATGIGGNSTNYAPLYDHWVKAGYVVAAPTFPLSNDKAPGGQTIADLKNQPGDLSFVLDAVLKDNADKKSPLHGLVDPSRVGLAGKSLGAITAVEAAYSTQARDPRFRAAILMTGLVLGAGDHFTGIDTPLLLVHGDADTTVPIQGSRDMFAQAGSPKYFVTLFGATHGSAFGGGTTPAERVVENTTTAFLDAYLANKGGTRERDIARARLVADGTVANVAALQSQH